MGGGKIRTPMDGLVLANTSTWTSAISIYIPPFLSQTVPGVTLPLDFY